MHDVITSVGYVDEDDMPCRLMCGDGDDGHKGDVFSPVGWVMGVSDTGDGQLPLSHTTPN